MKLFYYAFLFCFISITTSFAQSRTVGTISINEDKVYEAYTLLAPIHSGDNKTYLIDNCGDTVHTWPTTLGAGLSATLLENGNLLRPAVGGGSPIAAGGSAGKVQVFDWDGNILWDYTYASATYNTHHEVIAMPNGNYLILTWDAKDSTNCMENGRNIASLPDKSIWSEKIIEVEPTGLTTGNIVWEWDIWDHLIQDYDATKLNYGVVEDHPELMDINFLGLNGAGKDWLHANAIYYNEDLDQIIMSFRNTEEIYIIDHSTTTAEAASHTGGLSGKGGDFLFRWGNPIVYRKGTSAHQQLFAQHNSQWIKPGLKDAGKIMVFNNGSLRPGGNHSSVDIITPVTDVDGNYLMNADGRFLPDTVHWTYKAPNTGDFYAAYISGAERLPNGNTLICEGTWGRIFEIDSLKNKVWEYVSPIGTAGIISQGSSHSGFPLNGTSNWVFRANKYPADFPGLIARTLTPGDPIELNPLESLCENVTAIEENKNLETSIYPNPASELLTIEWTGEDHVQAEIYNVLGDRVKTALLYTGKNTLVIAQLPSGMYLIKIKDKAHRIIVK